MFLTLLHSERPKLYAILAFLSAVGLKLIADCQSVQTLVILSDFAFLLGCCLDQFICHIDVVEGKE